MSWSEIVQKNIKFHDEMDLMEKDSFIQLQHDNALNHINSVFHINERNISPVIQESCNGYFKEDGNQKYFRKRSVPSKKQKNYPVKPKKDIQYDIKEKKLESYNIINDYGNEANSSKDARHLQIPGRCNTTSETQGGEAGAGGGIEPC